MVSDSALVAAGPNELKYFTPVASSLPLPLRPARDLQHQSERWLSIVTRTDILVVSTLRLIPVNLGAIQDVEEDPNAVSLSQTLQVADSHEPATDQQSEDNSVPFVVLWPLRRRVYEDRHKSSTVGDG